MLTEPVECSSCHAVSVNGGTIHCHRCFSEIENSLKVSIRRVAELEAEALNWRGNFVLLANTINPEEDKPALDAAKELVARVAELEAQPKHGHGWWCSAAEMDRDRYHAALTQIARGKVADADYMDFASEALHPRP